jgi:hypothetical protein
MIHYNCTWSADMAQCEHRVANNGMKVNPVIHLSDHSQVR